MKLVKECVLILHQVYESITTGKKDKSEEELAFLHGWCGTVTGAPELEDMPEFAELRSELQTLMGKLSKSRDLEKRDANRFLEPLNRLSEALLKRLDVRLYVLPGLPKMENLPIKKGIRPVLVGTCEVPLISDDSIHILLIGGPENFANDEQRIDAVIELEEVYNWASFCYSTKGFDYDRVYLRSKLDCLRGGRNDVSIVLAGSSYTMVGLFENLMPRQAVNLAVNSQDPYFTFVSVETAKKNCKNIDTAVISSSYYFWHSDMTDNPSNYMRSVLTRVNYPVFGKKRGYAEELFPVMNKERSVPLIEAVFDLEKAQAKNEALLSRSLTYESYFNDEYNPRPSGGMLQYDFHTMDESINLSAAKHRAQAHANVLNERHLRENISLFRDFLSRMQKRNVRVILFVPPVTGYYGKNSSPELKDLFYKHFEPVLKDGGFEYVDLFDSTDYDDSDFKDYDHLNDKGAEKLSAFIAGML